jgi:hypothetical protein
METLYKKVIIKSEDDLPKEGIFICHHESIDNMLMINDMKWPGVNKRSIDWYLLSIEQPEPEPEIPSGEMKSANNILGKNLDSLEWTEETWNLIIEAMEEYAQLKMNAR